MPGVTLLCDAAHLSVPYGEGANLALQDGAEPATSIAAHPGDTEGALAAYERALFRRSAAENAEADRDFTRCFGDGTPQSLLDLFSGQVQG